MSTSPAVTGAATVDESHEYAACAFRYRSLATVMKATVKVVRRQGDGSESCLKDVPTVQRCVPACQG